MTKPKMRLTVRFVDSSGDSKTLSGIYGWLSALARLDHVRTLPNFKGFAITEI